MDQSSDQLKVQEQLADQSLAQQQRIADQQAAFNQSQFDYQKQQDAATQAAADQQAARQTQWDQSRTANATAATNSIDQAFAQFTPAYFQKYQQDYAQQADTEITRQEGLANRGLAFGLARSGNIAASTGAFQEGQVAQTAGEAKADQANASVTAADQLQSQVNQAKNNLTSQALSSDTLGSPIAPGSQESVTAGIDQANLAVSGVKAAAGDASAAITPVQPQLGSLAGLFSGAVTGAGSAIGGANAASYSAAFSGYGGGGFGGASPAATGLGGGSVRTY